MKATKFIIATISALAILFSMSLTSCGESNGEMSEEEKKDTLLDLEDAVMQVHDEVMPLTSEINSTKERLMTYMEEQGENISDARQGEIKNHIQKLEDAHQGMFDWMGEWGDSDVDNMEFEEAKDFYHDQKEVVDQVAEDMRSSLEEAKAFLQELRKDMDADNER